MIPPAQAFLYGEGFGRFSTEPYSLDPSSLANLYVHLTNSSIASERAATDGCAAHGAPVNAAHGGSKCTLSELRTRLAAAGIDVAAVWPRVIDVILRSLHAVSDAIPNQPRAFELYGYDVLIDDTLKPWLIEVNSSPSLARETPLDCEVKERLVHDTLQLVSPPYFDRIVWAHMLATRLAERSRATPPPFATEITALLHGQMPRAYGQMPERLGLYERIAPSAQWDRLRNRRGRGAR